MLYVFEVNSHQSATTLSIKSFLVYNMGIYKFDGLTQCDVIDVMSSGFLLKDTPNKGHHRSYLPTNDTF